MDFFKDIGMDKNDLFFILFLLIFSTILTVKMVGFNNQIGIYCSDVFVYLLNSLNFAGVNLNVNNTMYLSPVICFLTSILFRAGYVNTNAIYIVTGIFAIFGIVGFYFLLRYRFNRVLSLTGAVLLFSLSLNVLWLANGTLDVPAVGLTSIKPKRNNTDVQKQITGDKYIVLLTFKFIPTKLRAFKR